jgi:hypothetical protein
MENRDVSENHIHYGHRDLDRLHGASIGGERCLGASSDHNNREPYVHWR